MEITAEFRRQLVLDQQHMFDLATQLVHSGVSQNAAYLAAGFHLGLVAMTYPNSSAAEVYRVGVVRGQACDQCELSPYNPVPGFGDPSSPLFFLGEGPGQDELTYKLPFIGVSGMLLTLCLQALEVHRTKVFLSNATLCNRTMNGTLQHPTPNSLACCKPVWAMELDRIRPKHVVILGAKALEAALGLKGMKFYHGRSWEVTSLAGVPGPFKVHVLYHPSYILRSMQQDPQVKHDYYRKIRDIVAEAKASSPLYDFS